MYLQFGWGMMKLTEELLAKWKGGGVLISPRDLNVDQMSRVAKAAIKHGAEPLLDPQCFVHDADIERLTELPYWNKFRSVQTSSLSEPKHIDAVLSELSKLAKTLGISRHIVPALLATKVNDDWFNLQETMVERAVKVFGTNPLLATIALSSEAMEDETQIEAVVDRMGKLPVSGFYLVAETPTAYLVDSPLWLSNLLILASGLALTGKSVLVGYCNHQMLGLAATKVKGIASGSWLNVRAFQNEKFYQKDEDEVSRRAKGGWYYCPQALSEYKLQFLDVAHKQKMLEEMKPSDKLKCSYAKPLFAGPRPSTIVGWGESEAFRHYLCCLRSQYKLSVLSTFDATLDEQKRVLDVAEKLLTQLRKNGILGQDREFTNYVDTNRSALGLFSSARAARLRRAWDTLG